MLHTLYQSAYLLVSIIYVFFFMIIIKLSLFLTVACYIKHDLCFWLWSFPFFKYVQVQFYILKKNPRHCAASSMVALFIKMVVTMRRFRIVMHLPVWVRSTTLIDDVMEAVSRLVLVARNKQSNTGLTRKYNIILRPSICVLCKS